MKAKVKQFILGNNLIRVAIQEINLCEVSTSKVYYLWRNFLCDGSFTSDDANNGGLLSIWCISLGSLVVSFVGVSFLGDCFCWRVLNSILLL